MPVAGTLVCSYKAPDIWLKNKVNKRSHAIRKGLPDALDLLVICAEAGLTVDAAFGRVAKELGKAYPELGDEFGLTAIELGFLNERRQAFENLATRVDLEAVRGVVTTMIQTEKYGTPLASALRVLSAEFRNERMMRAEEKAARLPAIMTVPLILFILPTLFIVILGPGGLLDQRQLHRRRDPPVSGKAAAASPEAAAVLRQAILLRERKSRRRLIRQYHIRGTAMLNFTSDQWVIVALIFVLGLLVGGFLFSGGGRKWKHRYNGEVTRRTDLEKTHSQARKGMARTGQPARRRAQEPAARSVATARWRAEGAVRDVTATRSTIAV